MKNAIMITGTVYNAMLNKGLVCKYNVMIWGQRANEDLQFIMTIERELNGYTELWRHAKNIAAGYFKEPKMLDGAYTNYYDHLTIK